MMQSICPDRRGSEFMQMPTARTIPALLDELAHSWPEREAIVDGTKRFTYQQLRQAVRDFAKGLYGMGIRKGDKVAILMGNNAEWIIADLAICSLGAIMVSLNTWVTDRELKYLINHSDTRMLITCDYFLKSNYTAMLGELEPHHDNMPALEMIVQYPEANYKTALPYNEIPQRGAMVDDATIQHMADAVRPEDVSYILYTSGSTSTPKGVQLQHYALIENMWHIGERMGVTERDKLWLAVSLFWGLGCENALFNILTHGACIVLQNHFEAGEALRIIDAERCTLYYGTPNMAHAIEDHPERSRYDLSCVRGGGTMGSPEQFARILSWGAKDICNIYGLTETYGNCNVTDYRMPLEQRLTTVGEPLPGVDMRIVEETTGKVLGPNQIGEIRMKGYVTIGYYKDEDKNLAAFDENGYFCTGDIGFLDDNRNLHFRGRIKEMIKTGGINVSPVEVEELLMKHPAVRIAYVVGIQDSVRDEIIGAVIIQNPKIPLERSGLEEFARQEMASYKCPRQYIFLNETELPLTVTGKVQKNRLHELFTKC
jgi:fatty-acyl-CoA synthase